MLRTLSYLFFGTLIITLSSCTDSSEQSATKVIQTDQDSSTLNQHSDTNSLVSNLEESERKLEEASAEVEEWKSNGYRNIKGTRIFIQPPAGFIYPNASMEWESVRLSRITAFDTILNNGSRETKDFEAMVENMKQFLLDETKNIAVGKYKGQSFTTINYLNRGFHLTFEVDSFRVMVSGYTMKDSLAQFEKLKKSILAVKYDANFEVHPLRDVALFELNTRESAYRFSEMIAPPSSTFFYSKNGKKSSKIGNAPRFVIAQTLMDTSITPMLIMQEMLSGLISTGYVYEDFGNNTEGKINGYESCEYRMKAKLGNEQIEQYLLILKKGFTVISFTGQVSAGQKKELQEFERLAHSLKIREGKDFDEATSHPILTITP